LSNNDYFHALNNNNIFFRMNKRPLTPQFYSFLKDVAAHNDREWFKLNRFRFDNDVFLPFKELTEQVIELMQQIDPDIQINFKQAAFRFYRDTRFSADKSPYKLWMGAAISRGGRKNTRYPEIYFQFGPGENFIAGGLYRPDKEILFRIREKIAKNPAEFEAILTDKQILKQFPDGFKGERNKRLPVKQWQVLAKQYPALLNKQFYTIIYYKPEDILNQADLPAFIVRHYQALQKFNDWLMELD